MRFLIDNALSPRVAKLLADAGHEAVHVRDYGMQSSPDLDILARASAEDRIIVSADTDFGTLLALRQATSPSFILFRGGAPRRPEQQAASVLENIQALEADLTAACIAVFEPERIRVRRLPVGGG